MPYLSFTVDSALLRELGERLVGKPHIALAELAKNSYDADANQVTITFEPTEDRIEVRDDGDGMTFDEFRNYWMRIGTPHKAERRTSRRLHRPLTGSKGVGRLSVQFLAERLTIRTVARQSGGKWLEASVNWNEAVQSGELTQAQVAYSVKRSKPPFRKGTSIVMTTLRHQWDAAAVEDLAGELWWLQPPFRSPLARGPRKERFTISFVSPQRGLEEAFKQQFHAIMDIWYAKLVGRNDLGTIRLSVEFAGERAKPYEACIANFPHNTGQYDKRRNLNQGEFEIRIYHLRHRQPRGIRVQEAREYLSKFGGTHVYDAGFRLPYYGVPENDWLRTEIDHAHRLSRSRLLPDGLQISEGMNYLPTLGRIFGVVQVNTSREPRLNILITRDRLEDTVAFQDLACFVRYALDLYAHEEARRALERAEREKPVEPTTQRVETVAAVLRRHKREIPDKVYDKLDVQIREAIRAAEATEEITLRRVALLGPLATAGISALAYQHELHRQFRAGDEIVREIRRIKAGSVRLGRALRKLGGDLESWLDRARATNALFEYLANAENIETRQRFPATGVIEDVVRQTRFLQRGVEIDTNAVQEDLLLPSASLPEWGAIFQNVFTNAFTAMLESRRKLLHISSLARGRQRVILMQDTGCGVNLKRAEELFQPFKRKVRLSAERRALGYGGTGLGLTIVRLLADQIGCRVAFVEPDKGFKTAFSVRWTEKA